MQTVLPLEDEGLKSLFLTDIDGAGLGLLFLFFVLLLVVVQIKVVLSNKWKQKPLWLVQSVWPSSWKQFYKVVPAA